MKILWSTPWFGNYRVPVYDWLKKLTGDNFYLVCSETDTSDLVRQKLYDTLGGHVKILKGEKRITFGCNNTTLANKNLIIKRQPGLYNAIKEVNPDVVIVEGFGSWAPIGIKYAVLHRKTLCMFYERTAHVERSAPWYRKLYRKLVGIPVDWFLINGSLTENYLNKGLHFNNTPKTKGCMCADSFGLANSVASIQEKQKEEMRKELGIKNGLTYLFVGQMVVRKGIRELLAAWEKHTAKHPDDHLIAAGSGVLFDDLRKEYSTLKSVHLLGQVGYDKLHRYYALCDVFIMPTLEDNWCLVIPEAMACGKPVACSIYNGGHYELVKNGVNGYNFDPLNQESIISVLDKFHHADLAAMGREAVRIESDYTPDKSANRIYNACLAAYNRK